MPTAAARALLERLPRDGRLSKRSVEVLSLVVSAVIVARTVNLSWIASQFPGSSLIQSCYRRLQRFFFQGSLGRGVVGSNPG